MDLTPLELLNELQFANTNKLAREVFKKQKSKKENNSSLPGEELKGSDSVTSCLASANHRVEGHKAVDNKITPAITSSRAITGITAQHVKSERGIKVSLTIQTPQDRTLGQFISLTAELKRHGRLRELKRYAGDSAGFEQHYMDTISSLKDLTPQEGKNIGCGRIHQRGKRAAWFADMMVVGTLDDTGTRLKHIIVWYGCEEYEIDMDQDLTERQRVGYHTAGIYGEVITQAQVPTLATAVRRTL